MNHELVILIITAISLGFFHTIVGPDHYVPFIVMSHARRWSLVKTTIITIVCGLGHVLSSVLLGSIGILLGIAVSRLEGVESIRGELAAWLLISFGFTYGVWGLHRAIRTIPHQHGHHHENGKMHAHRHSHIHEHTHVHTVKDGKSITPWVLFTIFVFGPCEPLIPLLMYPAAKGNLMSALLVACIFSIVTICTMLGVVIVSSFGISYIPLGKIERYSHALAGFTIFLSGGAIKFLGL